MCKCVCRFCCVRVCMCVCACAHVHVWTCGCGFRCAAVCCKRAWARQLETGHPNASRGAGPPKWLASARPRVSAQCSKALPYAVRYAAGLRQHFFTLLHARHDARVDHQHRVSKRHRLRRTGCRLSALGAQEYFSPAGTLRACAWSTHFKGSQRRELGEVVGNMMPDRSGRSGRGVGARRARG